MGRVIINYTDDVSVTDAIADVLVVANMGRISGKNKESFCFCTKFKDDSVAIANVTKSGTDTFRVFKEV